MNWDEMLSTYLEVQCCSDAKVVEQRIGNNRKKASQLLQKQQEILKAFDAIKFAYAENPNASVDELKTKAYSFILGSTIFLFLAQLIISSVIRTAIDWFIKEIKKV